MQVAWSTWQAALTASVAYSLAPVAHRRLQSAAYMTGLSGMQEAGVQATAQASWSPLWAAPEVVRLEKGNVKADIWSLGLIIWVRSTL